MPNTLPVQQAYPHKDTDLGSERPIRSYVLRGRISHAQQRAYDSLLPRYSLPFANTIPDFSQVFGRQAPLILEIGFGSGESTVQIARQHPERDFLGVEVHTPGVGALLARIAEAKLTNVRIIQHDAREILEHMIAPSSLAGLHILFPDPWPKKRHHKRRLIQAPFITLAAKSLQPGGYVLLATDWEAYALQILDVLSAEPLLRNTGAGYVPRPAFRPLTKFEQRSLKQGHKVWDLIFTRTG
ncbi:MAG: tRNA (guanosine(46)-N7)-methyltransferase TrmB [Burkholderiales bacterium]